LVRDETSKAEVCCEVLYADETYLTNRRYPVPKNNPNNLIFLSAWYRRRLGLEREPIPCQRQFEIKLPTNLPAVWRQFKACTRHPQVVVVLSTVLAVVGTGLGVLGLATVFKKVPWVEYPLGISGMVIMVAGFWPLVLRAKN